MTTAITNATVIDATGAPPQHHVTVLVEGDRVSAIGPDVSIPQDAERIDATGRYLLPGMIDSHVHVTAPDYLPRAIKGSQEAYATVMACRNLRSALQAGVTTVRDVCGPRINLALRSAIRRGDLVGPRLYTAGIGICMTGGHGSGFPGATHEVDGETAVRQAVRTERKAGVDLIKLLTSDRTDAPEFTQAEIDAGVDEAHRQGLPVAIHAANFVTTRMSAVAGVDVIEHGSFIDEETADLMVEKSIALVPTLWVKHDLAERLTRWQDTPEEYTWGDVDDLGVAATWFRRCVDRLPTTMEIVHARGIAIAAGTDFVLSDEAWALLPEEIAWLTRLGLSNYEAIQSATIVGAKLLGLQEELGTIEVGKLADLILVDADPLTDISALETVGWVMQNGRVIPRSPEWDRRPIRDPLV